jgi:hypothetical protein
MVVTSTEEGTLGRVRFLGETGKEGQLNFGQVEILKVGNQATASL